MKLSAIRSSGKKAEKGAWVDGLPGAGDLALQVRAFGNSDYARRRLALYEAEPAENRPRGVLLPDIQKRHEDILLVETILTGWRNLEDDEGPITYSSERAAELIGEPDSDFRLLVVTAANSVRDAGKLDLEEAAGNSKKRSAGD
ncbi:hypothetical protein [Chenggangzhangella methanolivorans]|uniref:Uncharacterized protein n=1 Tax=Chenggangzhangella methanolivorans TaxID=1437009 RepID=A0A9E6R8P2_9HYPH|nr:hypothetical protein [Chenggangzhangella methanolivorans]QZN99546.1 hypothetical protein K6K41_23020 [Chenggangzhangella methanolivorans]